MKEATKRSIFRWIHIIFGIPILGYIYDSPTLELPNIQTLGMCFWLVARGAECVIRANYHAGVTYLR